TTKRSAAGIAMTATPRAPRIQRTAMPMTRSHRTGADGAVTWRVSGRAIVVIGGPPSSRRDQASPRSASRHRGERFQSGGGPPHTSKSWVTRLSAEHEIQVDRGSPVLMADHQEANSLGRSDRERRGVVDEVLVSGEAILDVGRQSVRCLFLPTYRSGRGDVALGERDADGDAQTEDHVEKAQQATDQEHEHETAAARQTSAAARTETGLLLVG